MFTVVCSDLEEKSKNFPTLVSFRFSWWLYSCEKNDIIFCLVL